MTQFSRKTDLLLRWGLNVTAILDKNTRANCHRFWDKILFRLTCYNVTNGPYFLGRNVQDLGGRTIPLLRVGMNVTVVNCHIRRFVGWTLQSGRNVTCCRHCILWRTQPETKMLCYFIYKCQSNTIVSHLCKGWKIKALKNSRIIIKIGKYSVICPQYALSIFTHIIPCERVPFSTTTNRKKEKS
jgi:hypothetical protein